MKADIRMLRRVIEDLHSQCDIVDGKIDTGPEDEDLDVSKPSDTLLLIVLDSSNASKLYVPLQQCFLKGSQRIADPGLRSSVDMWRILLRRTLCTQGMSRQCLLNIRALGRHFRTVEGLHHLSTSKHAA